MNNKKNFVSAIIYQFIHIIYGLAVPRIILLYFGSEINGLISSITQFLSFITLLEGGLGAVILAELYLPIENKDNERICRILASSQTFFNKISWLYICYTIILGIVYALCVKESFTFAFIFTLTIILSLTTLAEYLFSITYRLFLQADQKIYISNYVSAAMMLVNIVVAIVSVRLFPEIRVFKAFSAIVFFIQPIVLRRFIPDEFKHLKTKTLEKYDLKDRWSGFAQNLAHFVNMNTDIILITVFCRISEVSVYSVYMLAINALRMIVSTVANSYQSALGKYIAKNDENTLQNNFNKFTLLLSGATVVLFGTCLLLINQFVSIYTTNVNDINYYRPFFAAVILLANVVYCLREPFRLLILAAGKFKETNFGSVMEAVINVTISIIFIQRLGLIGVAFGTLAAMLYRMIYFMLFLRKHIIRLNIKNYLLSILPCVIVLVLNYFIYFKSPFIISNMISFAIYGILVLIAEVFITFVLCYILNKINLRKK